MNPPTKPARNLWPLSIIGFFIVFISFTVGLVVFASHQKLDLVGDDYYDQEIRYQEQLDRMNRTVNLKLPVSIVYDARANSIRVSLPSIQARHQVSGQIRLYCPSDDRLDREIKLTIDGKGMQNIDASQLRTGLWKVKVYWSVNGQDYYFGQPVVVRSNQS